MQAKHCKHVRTLLIGYRSGGTPYILRNPRRVLGLRAVDEGAVPASAPATSRLFVLPVATRRWVLTDNTFWLAQWDLKKATTSTAGMTGPHNQATVPSVTKPVTYEELTPEHQQKYDEVKASSKPISSALSRGPATTVSGGRGSHQRALLTTLIGPCGQRSVPGPYARR